MNGVSEKNEEFGSRPTLGFDYEAPQSQLLGLAVNVAYVQASLRNGSNFVYSDSLLVGGSGLFWGTNGRWFKGELAGGIGTLANLRSRGSVQESPFLRPAFFAHMKLGSWSDGPRPFFIRLRYLNVWGDSSLQIGFLEIGRGFALPGPH